MYLRTYVWLSLFGKEEEEEEKGRKENACTRKYIRSLRVHFFWPIWGKTASKKNTHNLIDMRRKNILLFSNRLKYTLEKPRTSESARASPFASRVKVLHLLCGDGRVEGQRGEGQEGKLGHLHLVSYPKNIFGQVMQNDVDDAPAKRVENMHGLFGALK